MAGPNEGTQAADDLGAAAEPLPTLMPPGGPFTCSQARRIYRGLWAESRGSPTGVGARGRNRSSRSSASRQCRTQEISAAVGGRGTHSAQPAQGAADTGADPSQSWVPRVRSDRNSKQAYGATEIASRLSVVVPSGDACAGWILGTVGSRVWRLVTVDLVAAAVRARRRDAMRRLGCDGVRVAWLGYGDAPSD
jgi:hypothetical protein